jgi:hypothetical protein
MILLNSTDAQEQDDLTTQWRDHKLNELSFIGVVVRRPIISFLLCTELSRSRAPS